MQGPLWRCSTTKLLGWLASSVWGTLCGSAVQCSAVYALELTLETCCNFRVITSDLITRECPCYSYIPEWLAMPLHEQPSPALPARSQRLAAPRASLTDYLPRYFHS